MFLTVSYKFIGNAKISLGLISCKQCASWKMFPQKKPGIISELAIIKFRGLTFRSILYTPVLHDSQQP